MDQFKIILANEPKRNGTSYTKEGESICIY